MAIIRQNIGSSQIVDGSVASADIADNSITPAKLQTDVDFTVNEITIGKGGNNVANNTAFGYNALIDNTTGSRNVAIGQTALRSNTTASDNTAVGYQAMLDNTTGIQNAALGRSALANCSTGSYNTAIGWSAASTLTTGGNNSTIGYGAEPSSATVSNEITLGNANITDVRIPGVGFYYSDASFNQKGMFGYHPEIARAIKYNAATSNPGSIVFNVNINQPAGIGWQQGVITIKAAKINAYSGSSQSLVGDYTFEYLYANNNPRDFITLREDRNSTGISVAFVGTSPENFTITVTATDSSVPSTIPYMNIVAAVEIVGGTGTPEQAITIT
jgi:hypothetical protein